MILLICIVCMRCTCCVCLFEFWFGGPMRTKLRAYPLHTINFHCYIYFVAIILSNEDRYTSVNINPKHCAMPQNAPTTTRYLVLCLLRYEVVVNSNNAKLFIPVEFSDHIFVYICVCICMRCSANSKCFVVPWIQFSPEYIYLPYNFLFVLDVHI